MGRKSVSNEIRQQIITLFQTGNNSNREIARQLRVSLSCVDNAVKRMQQTGTPKERPRSGRPSKVTPTFRRQLKRTVKKCRESRRKSLRALASQYSKLQVPASVTRRFGVRFIRTIFIAMRPPIVPPSKHITKRPV